MRYYWADKDSQKKKEEEANSPQEQPQIIVLGGGGSDSRSVESHDNVIMFYGEVNEENAKSLNKALRQMDKDLQVVKVKYGVEVPIKLYDRDWET